MTNDELLGRISAALAERQQVLAYAKKLQVIGGLLSNAAFNLKQQDRLASHDRAQLGELQRNWDEALRMRPAVLKETP